MLPRETFLFRSSRYLPLAQFIQNVMRGESPFTAGEQELIAAYVSGLNAGDYCYGSHQAIATDLNVEPKLLEAILKDIKTAPIKKSLRPVFNLVHRLTVDPSKTTQAGIDAVLAAGWDEQAVEDTIAVCPLFNFMNRFVDGYRLEQPQQEQLVAMVKGINTQGYQAVLQSST